MKQSLKSKHETSKDVIPQKRIVLETSDSSERSSDISTSTQVLYNENKNIPKSLGIDLEELPIDSFGGAYSKEIRPYIDVIDNLREFGLQQDIGLPNVVVVGDQSSGKSSIIESLSGIQLPRGKGFVTRCPLELQLKRVINKPWRAILKYITLEEDILITKPNEVEKLVLEAQDQICKSDNGISKELITLNIESPAINAPDLTLIDLPGIARTAVKDQPDDIYDKIKNIIIDYVKNENAVILCVISANVDAAVNESINIAKQYDPLGRRTLGVITKPDTAEEANKEDVMCLLNNQKIILEKGFHMVKCRSQKELIARLSLEQSIENEKIYFRNDKYYKTASETQLGIPNLSKRITEELVTLIKTNLPSLRKSISLNLQETRCIYAKLPEIIPEEKQDKLFYLDQLISDLSNEVIVCLEKGKSASITDNMFYEWRKLFERMKEEFNQINIEALQEKFTISNLKNQILKERRNEIIGFLNFEVFEELMKEHIQQYQVPANNLLLSMKKNAEHIFIRLINRYFEHLPAIQRDIKTIALNTLEEAYKGTNNQISTIFEKENLIFTLDQSFEREYDLMKQKRPHTSNTVVQSPVLITTSDLPGIFGKTTNMFGNNSQLSASTPVQFETSSVKNKDIKNAERLLSIIDCYLKIIHVRLCDSIPMTIRHSLHIELGKNLRRKFFMYVKEGNVDSKLKENNAVHEKRHHLKNKIKRLQFADSKLATF